MSVWSAVVLALMATTGGQASDFLLVKDGKPVATIVVSRDMNHATAFAVWELRHHIQKITGALLPIAFDDEPIKGNRILVGESKATRKLGIKSEALQEQEYLIRFYPNTLVLLGKDAPTPFADGISIFGEVKWTEGMFGKGLAFSGNGTVQVADCEFSDEEGSLEAWVYLEEKPQEGEGTILRLDGSNPWTYHIVSRVPQNRIRYMTYDGKQVYGITSGELPSGWHHILATYSASEGKMELFVDGINQGTAPYGKTTCNGATLLIGGLSIPHQNRVGNALFGVVDEVRLSKVRRKAMLPSQPFMPDEDTLLLLHMDEGKGVPRDALGLRRLNRPVNPPNPTEAQGTSYAVHDFLERFCDVRWYGPKEEMTWLPQKSTLAVKPKNIKRRPAFLWRMIYPFHHTYGMLKKLWDNPTPKELMLFWARHKVGGEKYACNHSFYGYYDRFLRSHPDWFAKGYEGKPPQMCYSNPEFIAQVIQDARDYFDGKGAKPGAQAAGDYFALVPMDNSLWCKCDECQRQLDPERLNKFFSNGYASDYVFAFVNKVAEAIAKSHPGKFISTLAYSSYAYYPKKVRLLPNVSVQLCLHIRNWPWAVAMRENDLRFYKEWLTKDKGRRFYLWLYYCFPEEVAMNGGWHCFPGFFAHEAAKAFKMFAKDGIRGVFLNGTGEQVDTYVTLKLLDDPSLDVDALLEEFFARYYGAASEPMKRIYLLIERTYCNPANYPEFVRKTKDDDFHQTEEMAWGYLGTEERMAELGRLMEEAKRLARTEQERKRVTLFEEGVWRYMVEGRKRYLKKRAMDEERKAFEPMRAKLKEQPPPKIVIPLVPNCDGDPEKVDWAKAVVLGRWFTVDGYPIKRKINARLAHDGEHLYICLEEELPTNMLQNSEQIWVGDDWEVFFANQREPPYYQIAIAPDGRFAAITYKRYRIEQGNWQCNAKILSKILPDRWVVLASIPIKNIPHSNGKFFANFYRASFTLDEFRFREFLAWSPNFAVDFHLLGRMGEFSLELR